jgi:tetratricopeptide (TPR) repeat protein
MAIQANTEKEILQQAHEAEAKQNFNLATELYKEEIKRHPLKTYAYDRLMIIYRKLKRYRDELHIVNKGIKAFEDYFKKKSEKLTTKHKQLTKLSKALIKSTGLSERNHEYFPEPLNKWRRRKEVVAKKLRTS